eukprot:5220541-Ditylum_brightwellii.AAC.1
MAQDDQTSRASGQKSFLKAPVSILWTECHHIRKHYYDLKKKGTKIRATLIKEKAKDQEAKGNMDEDQKLHNMLANEKQRERVKRLKKIKLQEARTRV